MSNPCHNKKDYNASLGYWLSPHVRFPIPLTLHFHLHLHLHLLYLKNNQLIPSQDILVENILDQHIFVFLPLELLLKGLCHGSPVCLILPITRPQSLWNLKQAK